MINHIFGKTFFMFTYFIVTSLLVIGTIFIISRKLRENE